MAIIAIVQFKCMRELINCVNYVEGYFIPSDIYPAVKTAIKRKSLHNEENVHIGAKAQNIKRNNKFYIDATTTDYTEQKTSEERYKATCG